MRSTRIIWYRNPRVLSFIAQALTLTIIAIVVLYMLNNAALNMEARGVQLGTWFLQTETSFKVGFSPFWDFELGKTKYWEVFVIGIQNTILVGVAGIIGATIVGFSVGVARLSDNWFLAKFSSIYVEIFRNIPLLLQVFFWYFVIILPILPNLQESFGFADAFFLNKKGIFTPNIEFQGVLPLVVFGIAAVICCTTVFYLRRWSITRFKETARTFPTFWVSLVILLGVFTLAYWVVSDALIVELPRPSRFGFKGGFWIPIPLLSLWLSLVIYTSAFIAENVRAGIQAVHSGQAEAAKALGFHNPLSMKLIQIPQAMRVIIPPTISQYLNLMKNSSLAIAIGYDDLVNIWMGVSLNQTGQAIVIIGMTMGVFTVLSLITSMIMNIYNKQTQLAER